MSYEEYVEIRTGNLAINGQDVGNVKLFAHLPGKEVHEIISGLTNGVIDTKEFVAKNGLRLTCDRHTYERIAKMFGITPVATADERILISAEEFVLTGDKYLGNYTLLNRGRASELPIGIECVQLTMQVGGYVNCVAADLNAAVTSVGSGDTGVLRAYDNATRIWLVERDVHANAFAALDVCSCTTAGIGTIAAAGDILPCGLWPDALQAGAEWVEDTDFALQIGLGAVSRLATGGMADPETVYGWYSYASVLSQTMNFPKGDTQISTRAEYIYTKTLQNGLTQEIKIPDGYILESPEIQHSPDGLTEYVFEVKSVEKAADVDAEHGYDKRIT